MNIITTELIVKREDVVPEEEAWREVKAAASDALARAGGTITHHHAVGREHKRWYAAESPPLYGEVLRAAKQRLDPRGVMNPGVLKLGEYRGKQLGLPWTAGSIGMVGRPKRPSA